MSNVKSFWGDEPDDVNKPEWTPVCVSPKGIIVTWQEKYGREKSEICIGLWETFDTGLFLYYTTMENIYLKNLRHDRQVTYVL